MGVTKGCHQGTPPLADLIDQGKTLVFISFSPSPSWLLHLSRQEYVECFSSLSLSHKAESLLIVKEKTLGVFILIFSLSPSLKPIPLAELLQWVSSRSVSAKEQEGRKEESNTRREAKKIGKYSMEFCLINWLKRA